MGITKYTLSSDAIARIQSIYPVQLYRNNTFQDKEKVQELCMAGVNNAHEYLERHSLGHRMSLFDENNVYKTIVALQNTLGLAEPPRKIECYDISHMSGTHAYGSMVVCIDGRMVKKYYRIFKVSHGNNDVENHKEMLLRRLNRSLGEHVSPAWQLPDLIIVDGGKGQLSGNYSILTSWMKEHAITKDIAIVGLAKREEELFLPKQMHNIQSQHTETGEQGGIIVSGSIRFLIQRIRDEAHRFAITHNQKARIRTASHSQLDDIRGIGEKTKQKILTHFGSLQSCVELLVSNRELVIEVVGTRVYDILKKHFKV